MRRYPAAGCAVTEILLPRDGIDLQKWAVVACDQFTSQPEYWRAVEELVGASPSTFKLIYPEVFLGEERADERIAAIRSAMQDYLSSGVLVPHTGLIYLERKTGDATRRGLMLALDLEQYDYSKGSTSLVRATEGTIVDRLPPRIKIREGASLELPHIMVLIDDPDDTVIGPLSSMKQELKPVYDIELMMESGHLAGWKIEDTSIEENVMDSIASLGDRELFLKKYELPSERFATLLYAMGDGNHSLATAKAIWEQEKERAEDRDAVMSSATRYALVELVNVYDPSLEFEPIHRVLFDVASERDIIKELESHFEGRVQFDEVETFDAMTAAVDVLERGVHRFGMVAGGVAKVVTVSGPDSNLAVGTLQGFLDAFMKSGGAGEIDYVHGTEPVDELGNRPGNLGFYLPAMSKHDLFKSVILDGALPRKTFSMGEAQDKRFYLECRKLS